MKDIADMARTNLIISKEKSKKYYDRFINPVNFQKGDQVWLIKEPKLGKLEKNQNLGPFEVLDVTENSNVIINKNGKPNTVHANKLVIHKKKN